MKVTKRQKHLEKKNLLMYKTDFKKPIMKPKPHKTHNLFLNPTKQKPWFHLFTPQHVTPPSPINYHEYSTSNSKHCYVKLRLPNITKQMGKQKQLLSQCWLPFSIQRQNRTSMHLIQFSAGPSFQSVTCGCVESHL